jgi:periplasmic divalent cation tolerance protein
MEEPAYIVVFVTVADAGEAQRISGRLLEQNKIACANIVPKVDSNFLWNGRIESESESLLIIKTRASLLSEVTVMIKDIHSYDVPEIIALPVIGGNRDYLEWIDKSVS